MNTTENDHEQSFTFSESSIDKRSIRLELIRLSNETLHHLIQWESQHKHDPCKEAVSRITAVSDFIYFHLHQLGEEISQATPPNNITTTNGSQNDQATPLNTHERQDIPGPERASPQDAEPPPEHKQQNHIQATPCTACVGSNGMAELAG